MLYILKNNTKTMQIELDKFFKENKKSSINMTKQAFSQIKVKISPGALLT